MESKSIMKSFMTLNIARSLFYSRMFFQILYFSKFLRIQVPQTDYFQWSDWFFASSKTTKSKVNPQDRKYFKHTQAH